MDLKERMADAIVNDFIFEHENGEAECLLCGGLGDFYGNIKHTSSCIVPQAKFFLRERDSGD